VCVVVGTAAQRVVAILAIGLVVAACGVHRIVAQSTLYNIVAIQAEKFIVACIVRPRRGQNVVGIGPGE
jgi:hypothetical protein